MMPAKRIHPPRGQRMSDTARWKRMRAHHLATNPLCVMCKAEGRVKAADTVDHKIPHRGDPALHWDWSNLQSLCAHHHNSHKHSEEMLGYSKAVGVDGLPIDPRHPWNMLT